MNEFARGQNRRESFEYKRGDNKFRTRADSTSSGSLMEYSNDRIDKGKESRPHLSNVNDGEEKREKEIHKTDWRCNCGCVNYQRNEECMIVQIILTRWFS